MKIKSYTVAFVYELNGVYQVGILTIPVAKRKEIQTLISEYLGQNVKILEMEKGSTEVPYIAVCNAVGVIDKLRSMKKF